MMERKAYEKLVMDHYTEVAKEAGESASSTMKSEYIREKETNAICTIIDNYIIKTEKKKLVILDLGCGNGYTLSLLKEKYPQNVYYGVEKNDELRALAQRRLETMGISVIAGDILDDTLSVGDKADIILSQRVIINLLDEADQKRAIGNISNMVLDKGIIIFIECFTEPLKNLNNARKEFDLPPIEPSFHNLYLGEDVLGVLDGQFEQLTEIDNLPSNFLSSYYYVSRVLHDVALNGKTFMRNSHFVRFNMEVVPQAVGDYSPLKLYVYQKSMRREK